MALSAWAGACHRLLVAFFGDFEFHLPFLGLLCGPDVPEVVSS
jgi:hypothetical protein